MIIESKEDKTVFVTTDRDLVMSILKSAGIENIKLSTTKYTCKLNRCLNQSQLKRVRYYLQKKLIRYQPVLKIVEMPEIIRGFKGCLITGEFLRWV